METLSGFDYAFICLALGGMAWGLLQFGVGAMLWADQKILMAVGFIAALGGLYLGLLVVFLLLSPFIG